MKKWVHELNREFSKEEVQMASKCMKKCSTFLVIKDIQIKSTLRFHLISVRMAISRAITAKNAGNDNVKQEPLCTICGNANSTTIRESSIEIPQKAKDQIPI
jgi:hypothetical protein